MPAINISGKFETTVTFKDKKDFTFKQWIDKKVAEQRIEYGHSNLCVWLEIPNEEDPTSPFTIPVNGSDFYEGSFVVTQVEQSFVFRFDGKAKATVHKLTKAKVDAGGVPKLSGLAINGQEKQIELPDCSFTASSKKL